jgi:hypothetical protein
MRIEGLATQLYLQQTAKKAGKETSQPEKSKKDQYVPSLPSRSMALESIKQKVKSGYYSSDAVAEDISDKLAKLFDKE